MNVYANLDVLKRALRLGSATTHDAFLLECAESASRAVDAYCRRHFYTWSGDRYFGVIDPCAVLIDDVLTVTAVGADSEGDGSFDGEAWVQGTDYSLQPRSKFPKSQLWPTKNPSKFLGVDREYLKITGAWGYGDGTGSNPWKSTTTTVTIADASTSSATAAAANRIFPGDTLLLGSEQVYVETVESTALTVVRGVNGTTAAAHAGVAALRAVYPMQVARFVSALSGEAFAKRTSQGVRMEMLGTHQVMYTDVDEKVFDRALVGLRRALAG